MNKLRHSSSGALFVYLVAVLGLSMVTQPILLAVALSLALLGAGDSRWRYLKRSLLAMLAFNLCVSLGYVVVALWQARFQAEYLLLINLRVLLLVYLGFWFVDRVDLLRATAFSPTLRLVLSLALGQIMVLRRLLDDYRLAFASRNLGAPRFLDRARHAAAQGQNLLDKSLAMAQESSLAMRSRGAFTLLEPGEKVSPAPQPMVWRPAKTQPGAPPWARRSR